MDWMPGLHELIGVKGSVTWWQMTVRGALIFLFGLVAMRLAGRRVFGRQTLLDTMLAIVIGSTLSRTITGNAPFVPTLAASAGLVVLHWVVAEIACRWAFFSRLVKGRAVPLVEDGSLNRKAMRRHAIGPHDLEEAARESGLEGLDRVERAMLERDGKISILSR